MKILCEKIVNTNAFAGTADIIVGLDDFKEEVIYNSEFHTYKLNGKIIPSVTSLLNDGSYDNVDKDILERAANIGRTVHLECQQWLQDHLEGFTDELQAFKGIYTQQPELFNQRAIIDLKTTARLDKEETRKQCQMYADGVEHLTGIKITKFYAIHLRGLKGKVVEL